MYSRGLPSVYRLNRPSVHPTSVSFVHARSSLKPGDKASSCNDCEKSTRCVSAPNPNAHLSFVLDRRIPFKAWLSNTDKRPQKRSSVEVSIRTQNQVFSDYLAGLQALIAAQALAF